jgi:hypothetical protein
VRSETEVQTEGSARGVKTRGDRLPEYNNRNNKLNQRHGERTHSSNAHRERHNDPETVVVTEVTEGGQRESAPSESKKQAHSRD